MVVYFKTEILDQSLEKNLLNKSNGKISKISIKEQLATKKLHLLLQVKYHNGWFVGRVQLFDCSVTGIIIYFANTEM